MYTTGVQLSQYIGERIVTTWRQRNIQQTVSLIRNYGYSFPTNCGDCIASNLDNWIQKDIDEGILPNI